MIQILQKHRCPVSHPVLFEFAGTRIKGSVSPAGGPGWTSWRDKNFVVCNCIHVLFCAIVYIYTVHNTLHRLSKRILNSNHMGLPLLSTWKWLLKEKHIRLLSHVAQITERS